MGNKYYYLVASLPYLSYGAVEFPKREVFFAECEKWFTVDDLALLRTADARNPRRYPAAQNEFLYRWGSFDSALRAALAEARPKHAVSGEKRLSDRMKELFSKETPLAMERHFELIRWSFLDEEERAYHFDLNWLIIYYLKIQILERLTAFNKEKGADMFGKMCEVAYE